MNKIDAPELEMHAASFYEFGTEQVFAISAEHGLGTADLLDAIAERVTEDPRETEAGAEEEIAVAVVGRPNVGKSSLVNRLLGFERSIVTDVPGTTRDAVDTLVIARGRALPHHRYGRDPAQRARRKGWPKRSAS